MTYPPPGQPQPGFPHQGQPQQPGFPPQQPGGFQPPQGQQPPQGYQPPQGQQPGYPPQQGQPGYSQPGFGQPGAPQQGQPGGPGYPPPVLPQQSGGGKGPLPRILGAVGSLVIIGVIIAVRVMSGNDSGGDGGGSNTTLTDDQYEAAAAASVGDCMTDVLDETEAADADPVVNCDDALAFWKITKVADDTGASVDSLGNLTDPQIALDTCGEEAAGLQPGQTWKSYQYIYTGYVTGKVDYLYCVEAIEKPDADGRLPVMPGLSDCFDSDVVWTVPCDSAGALYQIIDLHEVNPPAEMTEDEAYALVDECPSAEYYPLPIVDDKDRTTSVLCYNDAP